MSNITVGTTASASTTVTEQNTALAVKSGNLEVFATPMMVALMEEAACNCLSEYLLEGSSSVGTSVEIAHTSPSPLGIEVTATAKIESVDGRKVEFSVTARDENGDIGSGKHTRIIVEKERFMQKLSK